MGPVIILKCLLLFTFIYFVASEVCPAKCQCARNSVRCLQQELIAIPRTPVEAQTLDLRFNKIYEIAPSIFSHLHRLRSLLLNDNRLQALRSGAFHGLRRLRYLYLYRNRIQHIDPDVFQNLQHLEQLYLQVNEIHKIEPETFSNMPKLERLYLHNNLLKSIPPNSFRGISRMRKLRLDSNALICDCSVLWLVRMLNEHKDMKIAATCHGPEGVTGTSLASITEQRLPCQHPDIEKDPEDVVIDFGEDAMFSCVATGDPTPEIVWFRDSVAVPLENTHYEVMGNGTLMVHDVDLNDVGEFECMAKNLAGEMRSKRAKIMMRINPDQSGDPVFTVIPRKQFVQLHQSVSFNCVANGNPHPHIAWLFNNSRMLLNERISLKRNGTIVIKRVEISDAGNYTCKAENIYGTIYASADLEVKIAPAFVLVPNNQEITMGDKVEFSCKVRGAPKPVIKWYKNTMVLPPSENIAFNNNSEHLLITEVSKEDEGIYLCRAENSEGIIEISAILKVKDYRPGPPKINPKPEDTEAFKQTAVQIPCEVESELDTIIEWRKDGTRVVPNERVSISLIGSLIINNVTLADNGRYECSAFNHYGRDTASIFLTVRDHILPGDEYINIALTEAIRDIDQAIDNTIEKMLVNTSTVSDLHELFRIARFPNAPARDVARAAEVYERTLEKVKAFVETGKKVTSVESFNYNDYLSPQHLEVIARLSGCVAHRENKNCSDMCYHGKYRSYDGSCNNFAHPMWGASLTGFRRILYPVYENGFSQPIGWNKDMKYNGFKLPSARLISTEMITTSDITEDVQITHMAMQWGQWLDHDLDHALPPATAQSWDGVDCKKTCDYTAPCFPIDVPPNDPRINNRRCIDFIRTSSVCGSGTTSILFGKLQTREQINQLTSFIDASQVYGFEKKIAEDLQDLSNDDGFLRVGAKFPGRKPLLPTTGLNGMDCRRNLDESNRNCFVAGDIRANEQVGLAAIHTIWMREHNRLARQLKELNPFWNGHQVYQEARKIVGAQMQVITYNQWLPIVLGPEVHKDLKEYKGYNSNINPSISNVFATAALRFGHSMINPILNRYDENFETIPEGHLTLRHAFFSPWRLVDEGGVDPLLRGMFTTPAKLKTPTQNLNSELTEKLFYSAHAVALDLAAINIQRARDHGIPAYTKWREFCNMTEVDDFDDLANEISNKNVIDKLRKLYGSVHNIDVFVGGILEDQIKEGKVGPLFRCLLLEQFQRLRDGDRLWFENPSMFKPDQLQQLKKTSMARVLCDNGDNIDTISENVFLLPEVQDGMISCEDLPSMDLRFWMDCETCSEDKHKRETRRARRTINTFADNDNKQQNVLEDSQNDLKNTVDLLKKRVEFLEDYCHSHN